MAVDRFTPSEILRKIRFDPLTKKGSVLDVIQLVTGCQQKNATRTFDSISEKFPDVLQKVKDFKFPGQGQRPTPVAYLKDLIEIAWLCPGRSAKEFRRTGAVTLCRALGGDLSLVDEIRARHGDVSADEQEALLAGTGVTAAEANGQALAATDQRKVLADIEMTQAQAAKLRAEAEATAMQTYERLVAYGEREDDERDKLYFKDAARNFIRSRFPALEFKQESTQEDVQVTISEVAGDMGVRLRRGIESRIGKVAAALYRDRHGTSPPKHLRFVDGAVRAVNLYFERDRDLLEEAVTTALALQ